MNLLNSILIIYTWGIVCILLFFLFAIARFYEKRSGSRSFYLLFIIPIILFVGVTIRYLSLSSIVIAGDLWADIMFFVGGIILIGLGLFLLNLMLR